MVTSDWEMADSRIVISSVSEKSLSFAVRSTMSENPKRETCYSQTFGHRPHIYSRRSCHLPPLNLMNPFEPAPPLSQIIKEQHALWANSKP